MPEADHSDTTRRGLIALGTTSVLAMLGYATTATMLLSKSTTPPRPPAAPPVWPVPVASPAVSLAPAPSGTPSPAGPQRPTGIPTGRAAVAPPPESPAHHTAGATGGSATPQATSPRAGLVAGARIGLGLAGLPGYRLRHHDFVARVDAITASSGYTDRMDATFIVRAGRADAQCLSFESANYPGYFLRHRNFWLRLDKANGTALFDQDATFRPVAVGAGVALRSVNYPDRHLVPALGGIQLEPVPALLAAVFQALDPL